MAGPLLDGPAELGAGQDGYVQLPGQALEGAGDLSQGHGAVFRAAGVYELKIVDDKQVQPVLGLQSPRLAADLDNGLEGRFVDEQGQVGQRAVSLQHTMFFSLGYQVHAEPVAVYAGLGRQEPHGDLLAAHLQAEHTDHEAAPCCVARHVEGQSALAQAWPGGQYEHVRALKAAAQKLVQTREPDRHGRQMVGSRGQNGAAPLHVDIEEVTDWREIPGAVPRANAVEHLLGPGQRGVRVRAALVADLCDALARSDDPAHDRDAADYLGVVFEVHRGWDGGNQVRQVGDAAHSLQPVVLQGKLVGQGHLVYRLSPRQD